MVSMVLEFWILTCSLSMENTVEGRIFLANLRFFLTFITIKTVRMIRTRHVITAVRATWKMKL